MAAETMTDSNIMCLASTGNTETTLINELLGPAAAYDHRARPQFDAVNVSLVYALESILELVCTTP